MWSENGAGTGAQNTAIGYQAMKGAVGGGVGITGSFNVGLGSHANSRIADGTANVAVGHQANNNVSSGSYNIGIGMRANQNVTTGSRNIAIGHETMNGYDTENDNIAIGYDALGGTINGAEKNVVIGNYAGDAITEGDENTLLGHEAGTTLTTAKYSVAVGYRSLKNTDTGDRNTAVGYLSMEGAANNSADQNAAFGGYTLKNVQDGATGNTGLGYLSLSAVTTGDKNIAVGYESGDNITTGSNNVVIGKADVPSATADSRLSISDGDGGTTWIQGNEDGIVLGALTPLFYERAALDTSAVDFRVPTVQSSVANPNGYPMPFAGKVVAASFLFAGSAISTSGNTNTIRIRKNGGSSGSDIKEFTFTEGDLNNTNGNQYTLVKSGSDVSFTFAAGDVLQVKRQGGSTDLNNSQAMLWVSYNF